MLDISHIRVLALFTVFGSVMGVYFSRIADIQMGLSLTKEQFGLALGGLPAGIMIGLQFVGALTERVGARHVVSGGMVLFAMTLMALPLARDVVSLFLFLLAFGIGNSLINTGLNVEAARLEAVNGRRILNLCHAMWSAGSLTSAATSTGFIALGFSIPAHFGVIGGIVISATLLLFGASRFGPFGAQGAMISRRGARFVLPTRRVLSIFGFMMSAIVFEAITMSWSKIYVRDVVPDAGWLATMALPAFLSLQLVGRLVSDGLVARWGSVRTARLMTILLLAGALLLVAVPSIWFVLLGFGLIGLGISNAYPLSISATARIQDRPSAMNVASLAMVQTCFSLMISPMFGSIVERFGMRHGLMLLLPLPFLAYGLARHLKEDP